MNSNFKRKTFKKILFLFLILINVHFIFDKSLNTSFIKSSKIDNLLIIRNSNSNATRIGNTTCDTEVIWGNNIAFSLNFTYTEDNGTTWNPVIDPDAYCNITIKDIGSTTDLIISNMTPLGNGVFFKKINSSRLSAGSHHKYYSVIITGFCPKFPNPNPAYILIKINAIPTKISAHDYSTLEELPEKAYTAYFNELINITIKYCINESGNPLNKAHLSYEWLGLASIDFLLDPVNIGYYTLTINTSEAQTIGIKVISITASYENYTTQSDFLVYLNILERKTTLNNQTADLVYISRKILVQEAHNFTFTYRDAISNETIGDLTYANYDWEELYKNGTKVPGSFGSGSLIQNINKTYTLDFNTELRQAGYYFLYVTLKKENYIQKNAFINLEIILRPTLINGTTSTLTISKNIEFRTAYNFTFEINNTLTHSRIGDLDHAFYYWYRTDSNGTILEGPSENFDLIKDVNDLYILDFNTELMSIGFYRIYVEFHKENYSSRYAVINLEINSPLKIYINLPSPNDIFNIKAPDFELEIIGSYDSIWYTIDNGVTNITVSALSGTINQIEWNKRENGIVSIKFYANNTYRFVSYAIVQVTKYVPENPYRKVFGYNLAILLGVIIIITLAIKKKILDKGLKRER